MTNEPLHLIRLTYTNTDGTATARWREAGAYATPHLYTLRSARSVVSQLKKKTWIKAKIAIIPVTFVLGEPIE